MIDKKVARGPILETDIFSSDCKSCPLKNQFTVMGRSPLGTVQATCSVSPSLRGVSPNANG